MQDSNLDCQQLEDTLDAYFDLELDAVQAEVVELHLAGCASCTARLADIEKVVTQIKSLPDVPMSRDLSSAIEAKILSQGTQVRESSADSVVTFAPKSKSKTHLYWMASAAAVLALCFSATQFKPQVATNKVSPQADAGVVADNQLPVVKGSSPEPKASMSSKIEAPTKIAASEKVKAPIVAKKIDSSFAKEKMLPEFGKVGHNHDIIQNHVSDKESVIAFYEYENTDNASDLGISTNEDGLYAIKL